MDDTGELAFPSRTRWDMGLILEIRPSAGGPQLPAVVDLCVEFRSSGIGVAPEAAGSVIAPFRYAQIAYLHDDG